MTAWLPRDPCALEPLAGVRVLDFSELLPGPFMTQSLVELGADVLKIERPPHGDNGRRLGPALFDAVNRGKRSMLADLKDAAQRAEVLALVADADVLVESYRPGVIDRLGFGHAALQVLNPRLIHVSLSGYGATGPRAQWPGHDINYLATAGVVALAGRPGAESPSFGVPVADLGGAVYAMAALSAALFQRERTGVGQRLDVALADCMLHWVNVRSAVARAAGADTLDAQRRVFQLRPGYGVFRCRDGQMVSIAALEDHFFANLHRAFGLTAWAGAAHRTLRQRQPHAEDINAALQAAVGQLDRATLVERLIAADVPVAEVATLAELPAHPQFVERGLFGPTDSGALCRFPVTLAGVAPMPRSSPALGESQVRMPSGGDRA